MKRPSYARRNLYGFTLVEVAISLFIIVLLLASVVVPLQTQVQERKLDETKRLLDHARESLLGYAAAHGYFPCPADGASNGQEAAGADHVTGLCPTWHGFLPAAALGFRSNDAQGFAVDAWGLAANRIRYAVSSHAVGGIANPFTLTNGLRRVPMTSLGSTPLLYVCESGIGVNVGSDCGVAVTLASNAVVVVWSVGANGPTGGTSVHEAQNPNPNGGSADRIFVSRGHSTASGNEFDDVLTWIPATALVSRLLLADQFTPSALRVGSP